jgi:uncharacterized protein
LTAARSLWLAALCLIGFVSVARADALGAGLPSSPSDWVTDTVGALSAPTRSSLDRRLSEYASTSNHQVLVWIGDTTGAQPIEDFAVHAFDVWKVGRKGLDDGIVLFVLIKDRRVRIEVGYGLEDKVPDIVAGRIIRETMVPLLRAGNTDGAVSAGVEAIIARLDGKPAPGDGAGDDNLPLALSPLQLVLLVLGAIALLVFLVTHPMLAAFLLANVLSRGRGTDRGGSRGGFTGGGGRSGGGGASGSW